MNEAITVWWKANKMNVVIGLLSVVILVLLGFIGMVWYYRNQISKLQTQVLSVQIQEQGERIKSLEKLTTEMIGITAKMIDVADHLDKGLDVQYKKYQSVKESLDSLNKQTTEWESRLRSLQRSSPTRIPALPPTK